MDKDINKVLAKWVRTAREAANLSGEQLGAKIALELGTERGHTKSNISHWETEKHQPNISQLLAISKITGTLLPGEITKHMPPESRAEAARTVDASTLSLIYVDAKELGLLTLYRESTEMGRDLIEIACKNAPKRPSKIRSVKKA